MHSADHPIISVIIPVFNRAELIERTVKTALAQSVKNIEIIVVDDASTDCTESVVNQLDDPRVKYFRLEHNSGPSAARNVGIEKAEGDFVAFLDSDDEWNPIKLELQLAAIRQRNNPREFVCYTKVRVVEESVTYLLPTRNKYIDEPIGDFVLCGNHGIIHTSSILLPRNLAASNHFSVDQRIFEDWDFLLRLEKYGVVWIYVDRPLTTWNNEHRDDRLTLSRFDGSLWLNTHKQYLSKKAQKAFSIKGVILPLIRSRTRKLHSLKTLICAFPDSDLSLTVFAKLCVRIFTPPFILTRIKLFLSSGPWA